MDTTPACHVIYVDRTATRDCPVVAGSKESPIPADWQPVTRQVVQALVEAFGNGLFLPNSLSSPLRS